jgi:hypothetical protein
MKLGYFLGYQEAIFTSTEDESHTFLDKYTEYIDFG